MRFVIEKPRTKKGLSYIFKYSILKNAIISKNLDCNVHLVYRTPGRNPENDCSLIEAEYWLPNYKVDYYRFYIRTGVVPSPIRKKVEILFINEVLHKLVDWMIFITNQPDNSTIKSGKFAAFYRNGSLEIIN